MVVTERKAFITSSLQKNKKKHWQAMKEREQKDETESKKTKPSTNQEDTRNTSGDAGET